MLSLLLLLFFFRIRIRTTTQGRQDSGQLRVDSAVQWYREQFGFPRPASQSRQSSFYHLHFTVTRVFSTHRILIIIIIIIIRLMIHFGLRPCPPPPGKRTIRQVRRCLCSILTGSRPSSRRL